MPSTLLAIRADLRREGSRTIPRLGALGFWAILATLGVAVGAKRELRLRSRSKAWFLSMFLWLEMIEVSLANARVRQGLVFLPLCFVLSEWGHDGGYLLTVYCFVLANLRLGAGCLRGLYLW